ncbi:MAG: hypothetical protein ACHRHE_18035 [Tepidisphaerales bacterium]
MDSAFIRAIRAIRGQEVSACCILEELSGRDIHQPRNHAMMPPVQPVPPEPPTLDYAKPERLPITPYAGILAIALAVLSAIGNHATWPSLSEYQDLCSYALGRGFAVPPPDVVLGYRVGYGVPAFCIVAIDAIFSMILSVVLLVGGIQAMRQPMDDPWLLRFYIRWKAVFAFIGAIGSTWQFAVVVRITRHGPFGYSYDPVSMFLTALAAGVLGPVLVWWLLRVKG